MTREQFQRRTTVIGPIIEGGLYTWPGRQFEFTWSQDRPQYYLA